MNIIQLHGRLARDPQIKTTTQGVKYAKFSVACDRGITDGGQKLVDFIDCVAWRQSADLLENHFKKGKGIVLNGSLRITNYTDQAGQKRTSAEVHVDRLEFVCGDKRESSEAVSTDVAADAAENVPAAQPAGVGLCDVSEDPDPWEHC